MTGKSNMHSVPVLIVGAGPVGLTLANLLGQQGVHCCIIDKNHGPPEQSRAIGLTPPTLRVFKRLGLDCFFTEQGVRISKALIYGDDGMLGSLCFDDLPSEFNFIVAMPQSRTVQALAQNLLRYETVRFQRDVRLDRLSIDESIVQAFVSDAEGNHEIIEAQWLVGCDGRYSVVRDTVTEKISIRPYSPVFMMADYVDKTGWGDAAHLFFTSDGSLEAFPLPDGQRRWIVLLPHRGIENNEDFLESQIRKWAGIDVKGHRVTELSTFQPERVLARRYCRGRVILAGDAAHVMSPIGGQGMNTGIGDAEQLAAVIPALLQGSAGRRTLRSYFRDRKRYFKSACRRAALGMWFGVWRGRSLSRLRGMLLKRLFLRGPFATLLEKHYAMLNDRFRLRSIDYLLSPTGKHVFNERLFERIAEQYPLMTRILSLGRDAVWKRNLVQDLPSLSEPRCVDLACGNGDLAALLRERYRPARITGIDLTRAMLNEAEKRLGEQDIEFQQADMLNSGLQESSVDLVTVGYGLRNVSDLDKALDEIVRILKPGGYLGILEFSKPANPVLAAIEIGLLHFWGRLWGLVRTGHADTYGYIGDSLEQFPCYAELKSRLAARGLSIVSERRGLCGIVRTTIARYGRE